jgi:syntaxin 1B/2/3
MEDRLRELKKDVGAQVEYVAVNQVELQIAQTVETITPFISNINDIQAALRAIEVNNEEIVNLKEQHASATTVESEKRISKSLADKLNENNSYLDRIKGKLDTIKADLDKLSQVEEDKRDETELRIMQTQYDSMCVKFKKVLIDYQEVQMAFKSAVKNKVKRQVRALDDRITEEELEKVSEDPEAASKIIQERVIGLGHAKVRNAVADIQDKYKDIQKLEQSVSHIVQLLQDTAYLVHLQGEQLENIELNLTKAKNYMEKGVKELDDAKKSHQASRKKMCCLIILLLVALAIILGAMGGAGVF